MFPSRFLVFNLRVSATANQGALGFWVCPFLDPSPHNCQRHLPQVQIGAVGLLRQQGSWGVETLKWSLLSPVWIKSLLCGLGHTAVDFLTPANSPAAPHIHSFFQSSWNYSNFPNVPVPRWASAFTPVSFLPGMPSLNLFLLQEGTQVPFPLEHLCIPSSNGVWASSCLPLTTFLRRTVVYGLSACLPYWTLAILRVELTGFPFSPRPPQWEAHQKLV